MSLPGDMVNVPARFEPSSLFIMMVVPLTLVTTRHGGVVAPLGITYRNGGEFRGHITYFHSLLHPNVKSSKVSCRGKSLLLLLRSLLHDLNLILRQPVKFVDELVDLAVGSFDLELKAGFVDQIVPGLSK